MTTPSICPDHAAPGAATAAGPRRGVQSREKQVQTKTRAPARRDESLRVGKEGQRGQSQPEGKCMRRSRPWFTQFQ